MILDCHVHSGMGPVEKGDKAEFARRLRTAGIDGAIIFSPGPGQASPAARLAKVMAWCDGSPNLYPAFFIDPTARDSVRQVSRAVDRGIAAFKIICSHHHVGDRRCFKTYRAVARSGRPLLFHSGILWGKRPSSMYNRPVDFEVLLEVTGLRFSLAHISWPWCDECLAVYGKYLSARRAGKADVEMFIDTTPGTPEIYRKDALTKLYTVGYDIEDNVLFGTDGGTGSHYSPDWARAWIRRDRAILRAAGVSKAATDKMFAGNLLRFLGLPAKPPAKPHRKG